MAFARPMPVQDENAAATKPAANPGKGQAQPDAQRRSVPRILFALNAAYYSACSPGLSRDCWKTVANGQGPGVLQ
jgi:hypothetical protein